MKNLQVRKELNAAPVLFYEITSTFERMSLKTIKPNRWSSLHVGQMYLLNLIPKKRTGNVLFTV